MKVTKHLENDHVILYVSEGDTQATIVLDNERQMKRLGECLIDIERTGSKWVEISPK